MAKKDAWDYLLGDGQGDAEPTFDSEVGRSMLSAYLSGDTHVPDAVEDRIEGRKLDQGQFTSMQGLTGSHREKHALKLPVEAGARVRFLGDDGAVLAYDNPPVPGSEGTVVAARSASGETTAHLEHVFVRWDDGETRAIHASHLTAADAPLSKSAGKNRIRVANLDSVIGDFLKVAEDALVHRATKDLWALKRDGDQYVIERLFDDEGEPIKV